MGALSSLVFVFGTPGIRLSRVARQIRSKADDQKLKVIDFEDEYFKKKFKEKYNHSPSSMGEVIGDYPQFVIKEVVQEALKSIFDNVRKDKTERKTVVFAHLEYYSNRTREYYSAWDASMFSNEIIRELKGSKIILLIDDVYDMFIDLWGDSKSNNLYSYRNLTDDFLKSIKQKVSGSNDEKSFVLLEAKYSTLSELLFWRESELTLARSLSDALNLEFHIFGVKNDAKSFLKLVTEKIKTVYLSHVISDFRAKKKTSSVWPSIVTQINEIPRLLLDNLVVLAPTSIDELRLERFGQDGPGLSERWPFEQEQSLYIPPECDSKYEDVWGKTPNSYNILDLDFFDDEGNLRKLEESVSYGNTIDSLRQILKYQISGQITSRDLAIIENVSGLIVFRGLAGKEKHFSTGVGAEIRHWKNITMRNKELGRPVKLNKIVFAHFKEDLLKETDIKFNQYYTTNLNIVINKLGEEFDWIPKLNPDEKTGLANLLSGSSSNGSGPFGPMEITNNLNGLYEKNKDRLYKRSIEISQMGHQSYQLSFDHSFENLFRVFVFENWDDFKKRKKEIVDFILTNSIANNGDSDISEH